MKLTTMTQVTLDGVEAFLFGRAGRTRCSPKPGARELQVHGSGALIRRLLARDLVDELTLLTVPLIFGQGVRLFPTNGPDVELRQISVYGDEKGATVQVFEPVGPPEYCPNFA